MQQGLSVVPLKVIADLARTFSRTTSIIGAILERCLEPIGPQAILPSRG